MLEDFAEEVVTWLHRDAYRETKVIRNGPGAPATFKSSPRALRAELTRLEKEFKGLAEDADPLVATGEFLDVNHAKIQSLADRTLLSRFSWTTASMCTGTMRTKARATKCYLTLGSWWATRFVLATTTSDPSELDASTADTEILHRTSSQQIRYFWATRDICGALARAVASEPAAAKQLPELTHPAVDSLLLATRDYVRRQVLDLNNDARALAEAIAAPAGRLAGTKLEAVITSREVHSSPWIRFGDGELIPVALQEALGSLELPVLDLIDRRLGPLQRPALSKGEFFELATQDCLARSLGSSSTSADRPLKVRVSASNEGEVDAALGSPVDLIVECKARVPSARPDDTGRAFSSDASSAVGQLRKRLHALSIEGQPIVDRSGNEHRADAEVCGIGVVAHAYGGALLSPRMLDLLPAEPTTEYPVIVADLHTWIVVFAALGSAEGLRSYLRFRGEVLDSRLTALDELDLAVLYLNPHRERALREVRKMAATNPETCQLIAGCEIDRRDALETVYPRSPRVWQKVFYDQAQSQYGAYRVDG